jgi:GMP synthase (glutamine-hydrolysing)
VQWGKHFLSIQGHPEWSSDYARAMMNDRRGIIPSDTIDAGINSLQVAPQNDVFVEWIMDFVQYLQ